MAKFVGLAIQSALNQTYQDFEVVVCDNASTDNTAEILAQFQDPRLKIYRNTENVGAIRNFNLAIERASTEWIKFLEADDLLEPTCLETCMAMIAQDPEVDVVSAGRTRIYAGGTPFLREVHYHTEIVTSETVRGRVHVRSNEFGTPTDVMVRRSLLMSVGGFDPDYGTYLNDWDLWLRCQEKARKVAFVAESLVQVRSHPGQIGATGANRDIDVFYRMMDKRWAAHPAFGPRWWQGQYLRWLNGVAAVYRLPRQLLRPNMPPGMSRWDGFLCLAHHLGPVRLVGVWIVAVLFWPFYPYFRSRITNMEPLLPSGEVAPRSLFERPLFVWAVAGVYIATVFWILLKLNQGY